MTTTDIHASFAPHKMLEERESETTHACKAAFQTDAHTGEMSSQNATDQPRQPRSQGHDGGMQCIPTKYLRGKSGLSRVQIALLAYVLENPTKQGSRAVIAEECGCAANSVPRAAKKLEELGLIERTPGGGKDATAYRMGRNLRDDTRNIRVTRNMEDTATRNLDVTRNDDVTAQPETNGETQTRNTEVTATRNNPPPHPPNINTPPTFQDEASPSNEELCGKGGPGEDLFGAPPKRKRAATRKRPKRVKFYATEETMPHELNEAMCAYAAESKLVNGLRAQEFGKFRRYHIREQTLISSLEQRWETWVDNWAKRNPVKPDGAPAGYTRLPDGPDGKARYAKDQRMNFYRS